MQHVEREAGGSNDISPAVRLLKPPISSTGFDCFWPYVIKIGWRGKKCWGVIFKCLTTRCVHLDLLSNIGVDTFLLALKHFISCRGTPSEVLRTGKELPRGRIRAQRSIHCHGASARRETRQLQN